MIPLNSGNLWVHYFAMSTTKVQLFWKTEQKEGKNTIKVRELIVLTFPIAADEVSSINVHYTEVFTKFISKTFDPLTFVYNFLNSLSSIQRLYCIQLIEKPYSCCKSNCPKS